MLFSCLPRFNKKKSFSFKSWPSKAKSSKSTKTRKSWPWKSRHKGCKANSTSGAPRTLSSRKRKLPRSKAFKTRSKIWRAGWGGAVSICVNSLLGRWFVERIWPGRTAQISFLHLLNTWMHIAQSFLAKNVNVPRTRASSYYYLFLEKAGFI